MDVIKLQGSGVLEASPSLFETPLVACELLVSETILVAALADLLGQKPFQIIADLMEIGVFANKMHLLDFKTACKVARKYGVLLKKLE